MLMIHKLKSCDCLILQYLMMMYEIRIILLFSYLIDCIIIYLSEIFLEDMFNLKYTIKKSWFWIFFENMFNLKNIANKSWFWISLNDMFNLKNTLSINHDFESLLYHFCMLIVKKHLLSNVSIQVNQDENDIYSMYSILRSYFFSSQHHHECH